MEKHSPGPWKTCGANDDKCPCGIIWDATGEWSPAIVQKNSEELGASVGDEQFHADARLIAAAPELRATLKRITDLDLENWPNARPGYIDARDALIAEAVTLLARVDGPVTP